MKTVAIIPARLGSQRLKQKNLREIGGEPMIVWAIRKALLSGVFDEVYVNSESTVFEEYAIREGARFYRRPEVLGNNVATSEDYIRDFYENIECDRVVQIHSIAPLLTVEEVRGFVRMFKEGTHEVQLSCVLEQIECAFEGKPINFAFDRKTNSQELKPLQRIPWSITGWRKATYLDACCTGKTATYAGKVEFFALQRTSGFIVKHEEDFELVNALFPVLFPGGVLI
jgi:CMP-N-acetylneuraminic acid synthetase